MVFSPEQLKDLKKRESQLNPDSVWVKKNREYLLSQIRNTTTEETKSFLQYDVFQWIHMFIPKMVRSVALKALIFVLVLSTTLGGWAASASASPDSPLWQVKRATQKLDEATSFKADSKANARKKILETSAVEVKHYAQKNDKESVKKLVKAGDHLNESVESVKKSIEEVKTEDAVNLALDLTKVTTEASKTMKEAIEVLHQEGDQETLDAAKEVLNTTKEVESKALDAMVSAVKKQDKEGVEMSAEKGEEVKNVIKEKIAELSAVKAEADVVTQQAKDAVIVTQSNIDTSSTTTAQDTSTTTIVEASTSTVDMMNSPSQVLKIMNSTEVVQLEQAIQVVDDNTKEITDTGTKIGVLVESNQILEALEKTRELTEKSAVAVETIVEIKQTINTTVND